MRRMSLNPAAWLRERRATRRVRTPTVLQMEAVECGAAALGSVLGYYGAIVPLEELRLACGVSRDGSKASNLVKAARKYGLKAQGHKREPQDLPTLPLPMIVFWNLNHFVVVEGFGAGRVFLNDPAAGPRVVSAEEFDQSFAGVALAFEPDVGFQKVGTRPSLIAGLRRRLIGSRRGLLYVVLAALALVVPGLVVPTFTRVFVDKVLIGGLADWIHPVALGMVVTGGLLGLLTWLQQSHLLRLETKLALSTSANFFWHVLRLPIEFYTQRYAGDIAWRMSLNDKVARLLSGEAATTLVSLVLVVFFALLMAQYDVILTLIGIGTAVLNVAALRIASRRRTDANEKLLQARGKLMATSMSGLQMIETLKATGTEADFFARWSGHQARVMNAEQELGFSSQLLSPVPVLLSSLTTIAILVLGGLRVMDGVLTVGMLVAFQTLMLGFIAPVNQLVDLGAKLQEAEGDMHRLDDVLRYPLDGQVAASTAGSGATGVGKLAGAIELRGVTFGYSRLDTPLIENFNLTVRPGSRVALIGGSGSGKSTIARLVTGLYEPWAGEILFDGQPRATLPRPLLTNSLAMVDQEIFLFEGSLRENLTLWDESLSEASILQAARDAAIHEDISDRPLTYDALVAEEGRNFSGGQRQRLEIARALVGNPSIVILDEATSALDPMTEKIVDDNLRRRGCTCLIIAHRLSTIRDCDEIIVLQQGKVVQRGTHEGMRDVPGPYAALIQME